MESKLLPWRIAHPTRPSLDYLNDSYFRMLQKAGYTGLYLNISPFDALTHNAAQFFRDFHLISLYDLAYSFERDRMRAYVNEVCARAGRFGLSTHLMFCEPRLPYYAWSSTPPSWRGRGGWPGANGPEISFCWSVPEAVAYWKQMACDALATVPEVAGVWFALIDNEAFPCDEKCPRCKGQTAGQMIRDIFETFQNIKNRRERPFTIALADWWLKPEMMVQVREVLDREAMIIGRSSRGHVQEIDGRRLNGMVEDMTMIVDGCSEEFLKEQKLFAGKGFRFSDLTAWSHPNESWFLPAPPDPEYAIEKLRSIAASGAEGWYDFDCGALEAGSIHLAIVAWTDHPHRTTAELVDEVLRGIYGDDAPAAGKAYELYHRAKGYFPLAHTASDLAAYSGRALGLGMCLVGPYVIEDFGFFDTSHSFNWFAPYSLVTPDILRDVLPHMEKLADLLGEGNAAIRAVPGDSEAICRERDAFEIHYRQAISIVSYLQLGRAKLQWLEHQISQDDFERFVRIMAIREMENLDATELWLARNPGGLSNPCHDLLGKVQECWPGADFTQGILIPKRRSLEKLLNYRVGPPRPAHLLR